MANGNNKRLKAFVRFDGSGRVVPSSLILQQKMPKVGNWQEVSAYECCNYVPTTTTTTTAGLALRLSFDTIASADLLVGDSSNVSDWNTFFDLPTLGTPFTSVQVSGNDILLYGGANIKVKPGLMFDNYTPTLFLLAIDDQAGCITSVGGDAFSYCDGLISVNLPACTILYPDTDSPYVAYGPFGECYNLVNVTIPLLEQIGAYSFTVCESIVTIDFPNATTVGSRAFDTCIGITSINLPNVTTMGNGAMQFCTSLTSISLPSLVSTTGNAIFSNCIAATSISLPNLTSMPGLFGFDNCDSLTTLYLPSCTTLGNTVGDDFMFQNLTGATITLTVPSALMTCNSGNPDGDIQFLQANNTVTVVTV